MTALAWTAVLGPILAGAVGILVGYFMGVAHNAEELGELGERCESLEVQVRAARAQLGAAAAAPPARGESRRVLDMVAPRAVS